jgi:hypothetical protein
MVFDEHEDSVASPPMDTAVETTNSRRPTMTLPIRVLTPNVKARRMEKCTASWQAA